MILIIVAPGLLVLTNSHPEPCVSTGQGSGPAYQTLKTSLTPHRLQQTPPGLPRNFPLSLEAFTPGGAFGVG